MRRWADGINMKRLVLWMVVAAVVAVTPRGAYAQPGDRTLRGALVGTALGLLIGHSSDAVDTGVAAPVFGLMGAAIGHELDREAEWRAHLEVAREEAGYGRRWVTSQPEPPAERARPTAAIAPPDVPGNDRHPGVELIKFAIVDDRGVSRSIAIIRMGTRFVGPRGESYDTLPDEKTLTERYGKTRCEP